jgi:hypothetical protein
MKQDPNKNYFEEYMDLAALCYLTTMSYERFLLDEIDYRQLAKVMKALLEALPEDTTVEPEPPSAGFFDN